MRWGTTIAAAVLVGSLTTSTAELGPLSAPSAPVANRAAVPHPDRTGSTPAARDTWSVDLSAGEGAGVTVAGGAARLDPSGVFLAPLEEEGVDDGIAGTGSTGADTGAGPAGSIEAGPAGGAGRARTEGAPSEPSRPAVGTAVPTGLLTLPIQRLRAASLRIDTLVAGSVPAGSSATVDVRGRDDDGNWSEWIPAGGSAVTLPNPVVVVQGRLVLTGPPAGVGGSTGPAVRGVTLTAHPVPQAGSTAPTPTPTSRPTPTPTASPTTVPTDLPPTDVPPTDLLPTVAPTEAPGPALTTTPSPPGITEDDDEDDDEPSSSAKKSTTTTKAPSSSATARPAGKPLRYRVFATREGLVGRTTANGHKIKSKDRFVALPSRRALSPRGKSDYSVKVCAANGRCAVAPVWDVGPWNTRDDYWNPASRRQEWRDLPQGMPQAQAAKERGYNKGRDQFGRQVRNPAGIDLSDGLFWGALGLKDNSWVTVEYLWTGAGKEGRSTAG